MSRTLPHNNPGCGAVGKCSVPMWSGGCPDGFCDAPAYGQQYGTAFAVGRFIFPTERPFAPGFCCEVHGGPPEKGKLRFVRDGGAWCCFAPDFENLQESVAGFGGTQSEAAADYRRQVPA